MSRTSNYQVYLMTKANVHSKEKARFATDAQIRAFTDLEEKCRRYGIDYTYGTPKKEVIMRSFLAASDYICQLYTKLLAIGAFETKYVVLVRNLKTGEKKKVLSPSQRRAPKGYELIGKIETVRVWKDTGEVVEDINGCS